MSKSPCPCLSGIVTCRGDSCRFPVIGNGCSSDQLGGPFLLTNGSSSIRGCLGNGVVRMGGIRGNCDEDATGGDGCGEVLGNGGISHGRGMRSSDEGAVLLTDGNGLLSVRWVVGIDIGKDRGKGILTGSGVSSIETVGSYCSIDEYRR